MRMMGTDSVAYHREAIIERGDDLAMTDDWVVRPPDFFDVVPKSIGKVTLGQID
jgi:hypothetical protein